MTSVSVHEEGDRGVCRKGEEKTRLRSGDFVLCGFSFTGN